MTWDPDRLEELSTAAEVTKPSWSCWSWWIPSQPSSGKMYDLCRIVFIHVHTCSYMFIHVHIPCYISLIFFDIISSLLKLIFPFRSPTCRSQICALPSGQLSMVCGDHRSPTFTKGFQFYSIFHHISIYFP